MLSTKSKAKVGAKTAKGIVESPLLRSAVTEAAPPIAKLGVKAGKKRMSRKARKQLEQFGDTVGTVASLATDYAPQAAKAAQQLGLVEPPKQKKTGPRVLFGVFIGVVATYLLEPGEAGRAHRARVQKLLA